MLPVTRTQRNLYRHAGNASINLTITINGMTTGYKGVGESLWVGTQKTIQGWRSYV